MRGTSKETLKSFTERAVRATVEGTLFPPAVYIPAGLRKRKVRVREVHTINPADAKENELRVAACDPTGFLIAVMQGQPIPTFHVKEHGGKIIVETDFAIPDLLLRSEVAMELSRRNRRADPKAKADYDAMIARAATAEDHEAVAEGER
jgi:hypothetical protein